MAATKIRAADFAKIAETGQLAPVCLALGDEPLMLDHVERTARAIPEETTRDFNLDVLHGDSLDARELAPAVSALPMMTEKRVVLVKHAQNLTPTVQKYLAEYVKNPVDSTILVLLMRVDGKPPAWIQKLSTQVTVVDCTTPRKRALADWATQKAREYGVNIDDDALSLLMDSGGRLLELQGELLKASLLIEEGDTITTAVLQRVWGIEEEVDIWKFFDHVASGDTLTALRELAILEDHLDRDSGFFFSQISRRWRMVAKERQYDEKGVPQGKRKWSGNTKRQWQMTTNEVRGLSKEFVERPMERLLELDRRRKSASLDAGVGFATLIHHIASDQKDAS